MRTLSILVSLSLAIGSAAMAAPGRDKPKHEREKEKPDQARERAQVDAQLRVESNRLSDASTWALQHIPGFRRSPELQLAMRTRPYTVEVVDAASKVRSDYKPLVVSDLVAEIMKNAKSGNLSAEKTALVKEAITFASFFAKIYTGTDPVLKRAQDAAYRQLETLADMTAPGFAEQKPNEIKSTMEFLVKANQAATGSTTIADVYLAGIKATRGEDPAIIREELEDIANCKKGA